MAAPKKWGYTRDQAVPDEVLVSWADGDLTAVVAKEVEERMLSSASDREAAAEFARDAELSRDPGDRRDFLEAPRPGVLERCIALAESPDLVADFGGGVADRVRPGFRTLFGAVIGLGIALAVIGWMLQNFR